MFAKIFAFIFTFLLLLLSPILVFAQTSTPSASSLQSLPPNVSPTSPLYTDLLVNNLFHSFSCIAVGQSVIGQPCLTYKVTQNAQGMIQSVPMLSSVNTSGGVLGTTTSLISALYANPPVRTADYLASIGNDLGIVKTVNAQVAGSGSQVLNPVLQLWQTSRNISYVIMIIIFLIIGLMVMFRNKINPQTVITAQAALPGLVIGLIMITFSFFFAGLISDMAFVGTNVVGYYFSAVKGQADKPENLVNKLSSENVLSVFSHFVGIVTPGKAQNIVSSIYGNMGESAQNAIRVVVFFLTAQFIMPLAGTAIPPPLGLLLGPAISLGAGIGMNLALPTLLGLFVSFAAILALVYQMIKLLLRLIMAFLTIIFLTITAPFQLLFASLPGRQGIATGWILNMLGNILIFPAVIAVFYFVAFILNQNTGPFTVSDLNQIQNDSIIPTAYAADPVRVVNSNTFPLLGGMNLEFIQIILAFGALMALPGIPDIIVKTVGKAGQAGQVIGQEISGGVRSGQGYAQRTGTSIIGFGQAANTSIRGEKTLVYDPLTKKYVPGIARPGYFDWRAATSSAKTPPATTGTR